MVLYNSGAQPIDGRAPYSRASFVDTLRSIINYVQPDYIRTQSSIGHRDPHPNADNVDHTASAILAAEADTDWAGNTWKRRDEYQGYVIRQLPENVFGYWRSEKLAIWHEYQPHDPYVPPGAWDDVAGKQYLPSSRIFWPGIPWVPPPDYNPAGCP